MRNRLLTYLLLTCILSLAVIGYVSFEFAYRAAVEQAKAHLQTVAMLKENAVNEWLEHFSEEIDALSRRREFRDGATALASSVGEPDPAIQLAVAGQLEDLANSEHLSPVFIADAASGVILVASDPALEGASRLGENYLESGKQGLFVSDLSYSEALPAPILIVSTPVKNEAGAVVAVLVSNADATYLGDVMGDWDGLGETGEAFLVNASGVPVTSTLLAPQATFAEALSDKAIDRSIQGETGADFIKKYSGVRAVAAYRWIDSMRLGLVVEQDSSEAFAALAHLRNIYTLAGLIMVALVSIACIFVARVTTIPLRRLAGYATSIGEGDYTAQLPVQGQDEVASVSLAIKSMVDRLLATQRELQLSLSAFDSSASGLAVTNLDGAVTYANPAFARMFGYQTDREIIGVRIAGLFHDPDRAALRVEGLCLGGPTLIMDAIGRRGSSEFPLEVRASSVKDEAGRCVGLVGSFTDISERKKSEQALAESEEKYRMLFENSREGMIICAEGGKILSANPAAAAILQYEEASDLTGVSAYSLISSAASFDEAAKSLRERGHIENVSLRLLTRTGAPVEVIASVTSSRDPAGKVRRIEAIFLDVSERNRLQEKLIASQRLATLGQFSGSLSHEIRNPLGVIDSSAYYLQARLKDSGDEKLGQHLERIRSAVAGSTAIIESLLNLTQSREPHLKVLDLAKLCSESLSMFGIPETVTVVYNAPGEPVLVAADRQQLHMSFENIVKNAIDAMEGRGRLEIAVQRQSDGWAQISFSDTGPGIPPQNLQRVFEPLFSTKVNGVGFGLSIAKLVADKHHARIEAQSGKEGGTTILIRFPPIPESVTSASDSHLPPGPGP